MATVPPCSSMARSFATSRWAATCSNCETPPTERSLPSASSVARCSNLPFGLPHQLKYSVLTERLAVCRFAADARFPAWAFEGGFFSIARTHDELSIVCSEDLLPENSLAER